MTGERSIFCRLSELSHIREEVCRRDLGDDRRRQLIDQIVAVDDWLGGLTRREVEECLDREVMVSEARRWFCQQLRGAEDSLAADARRESLALKDLVSPSTSALARIVSRPRRKLDRYLRHYSRRRGRSISKWAPGFGEVSTSLAIRGNENLIHLHRGGVWGKRVYKRMPAFPNRAEAERYQEVYFAYDRFLREDVGLDVPPTGVQMLARPGAQVLVFVWQLQLDSDTIGPAVLRRLEKGKALDLLDLVVDSLKLLFEANKRLASRGLRVGLDGQITNWAVEGLDAAGKLHSHSRLIFLDTNTPLIRQDGKELLDLEIFLKVLSPVLRPLVRRFFLKKILDRYYDPRTILLDFLGNTIVQGRSDLVDAFVRRVEERRVADLKPFAIERISGEDVQRYFREDVFTWRLVRTARTLQEAASAAGSGRPVVVWERLRHVKRIWTSDLFDVGGGNLGETPSNGSG